MRGSAPWQSLWGTVLYSVLSTAMHQREKGQQILVCASWLRLCGPDREASFKLGPFKKGFRWTHTVSGLLGYP